MLYRQEVLMKRLINGWLEVFTTFRGVTTQVTSTWNKYLYDIIRPH